MGKRQRRREREFIRAPAPPIPSTPAAVVPASEQGLPKLRKEFRRIFAQLRKSTIKRLRASAQPATVPHEAAVVAAAGDEPTFIPNPQELFSEEEWQAATADLGGAIEGIVTGSAQNVVGSAGYAFDVSNPLMGQAVRAHVDAIASWAPDLQNRVAEVVKEGVDAGWSVDAIAEALAEGPLSEARAMLIARCLPPETPIDGAVVGAVWRRWYEGDLVDLVTESGRHLSATPNHPMFTDRGWVAAGQLGEGDHLVCRSAFEDAGAAGDEYVADPPPTIAEVFEAAAAVGVVERRNGGQPDFHGDGRDGEVDIARPDRVLTFGDFTPLYEKVVESVLTPTDAVVPPAFCVACRRLLSVDQQSCLCGGPGCNALFSEQTPDETSGYAECIPDPDGRFAGQEPLGHLLPVDVRPQVRRVPACGVEVAAGVGQRPGHTGFPDPLEDGGLVDAEAQSHLAGAEAGDVGLDRLVSCRRRKFSGHVFNLSTPYGYFTADGCYTGNTEAIRAANAGAYIGMREVPFIKRKQWLATGDLRTRDTHRVADGQVVGIDEPFFVGGWPAAYPGDPSLPAEESINCRCTLLALEAADDTPEDIPSEAKVEFPPQAEFSMSATTQGFVLPISAEVPMTVTDVNTAIARTMAGFAGVPFQNPAGMTGAMIALLPADQEALAQSGGDPAAALHVTVCYLTSDASQLSAEDVAAAQMAAAEAAAAHGPFESTVSGAGVLGGEDPPATVLFLESESFQAVHDHVWSELEDYGSEAWHDQHPGYIPHLTLGYGLDVALAQGLMGTTVAFDRIVVVLADAVTEYQLGVETNQPPGEGEGYGRKRPTGYEEDDMAVPPAPAKAPPPPPAKAPAPPPAKAPAEGDSVTWQDADGNDVTGEVVSFNDPDNKPDSGDETVTVQPEGTTDEADQVTVDASKVKVEEAKPAPSPGQAPPPAPGQTPMTAEHEFVAISEKSWDGSAARFNDDQYQKACAACGPASEGTVKERCFLPHHEPDGTLNRAGVHAAAQRIGSLSGRPADAVSSAKSHLRSHYSDLGEEAPDSVATAAPKDFATGSPASFDAQPSGRWRGVLIVEGLPSGDGRMIEEGALTWRELPLPLMAMFENPVGGMGHDGAELAGRIDNIWRDGGNIWGEGVFDLSGPSGVEAHRLVAEKMMRGVSADLDMVEIDFENPEPSLDAPLEDLLAWDPGMMIVVSGRVMGATCTVFPAFEEATISLLDEAPAEALVASCGVALTGATLRTWLPYNGEAGALVASAGATVGGPAEPPLAWFSMPEFDRDHPIHPVRVTPEGRVYGWVSDWKECHIGFAGRCITPPKTRCNYRRFTTGQVLTAEGELVAVGRVYADTVHPSLKMKASDAAAFYAHSGCCLAYVRAYEDSRGIYIAGAVRPGVTADQVRILRGADMSPDWRPFPGGPEMIGILSVNVSGFVTPDEALVASAGGGYVRPGVTRAWVNADTGSVKALVGAGTAGLRRRSPLAAKVEALEAQLAELKAAIRPLRRDRAVGRASLRNGVELKTELGVSHCGSDCSCRSAH